MRTGSFAVSTQCLFCSTADTSGRYTGPEDPHGSRTHHAHRQGPARRHSLHPDCSGGYFAYTHALSRFAAEQRIARGVRNADGVFTWTYFDLEGDIPADVPIEALRTAVANGARSSTNPVDGKLYVLNTDDASILVLPRTVIASASDFNLPYVSAPSLSTRTEHSTSA